MKINFSQLFDRADVYDLDLVADALPAPTLPAPAFTSITQKVNTKTGLSLSQSTNNESDKIKTSAAAPAGNTNTPNTSYTGYRRFSMRRIAVIAACCGLLCAIALFGAGYLFEKDDKPTEGMENGGHGGTNTDSSRPNSVNALEKRADFNDILFSGFTFDDEELDDFTNSGEFDAAHPDEEPSYEPSDGENEIVIGSSNSCEPVDPVPNIPQEQEWNRLLLSRELFRLVSSDLSGDTLLAITTDLRTDALLQLEKKGYAVYTGTSGTYFFVLRLDQMTEFASDVYALVNSGDNDLILFPSFRLATREELNAEREETSVREFYSKSDVTTDINTMEEETTCHGEGSDVIDEIPGFESDYVTTSPNDTIVPDDTMEEVTKE